MAKDKPKQKNRLREILILLFVVVVMALSVVEIGRSVASEIRTEQHSGEVLQAIATPQNSVPTGPTPTNSGNIAVDY